MKTCVKLVDVLELFQLARLKRVIVHDCEGVCTAQDSLRGGLIVGLERAPGVLVQFFIACGVDQQLGVQLGDLPLDLGRGFHR